MAKDSERARGTGGYQYTVKDCDCTVCLHFSRETGCKLEVCCCAEERRLALEREEKKARKGRRKRSGPCRG